MTEPGPQIAVSCGISAARPAGNPGRRPVHAASGCLVMISPPARVVRPVPIYLPSVWRSGLRGYGGRRLRVRLRPRAAGPGRLARNQEGPGRRADGARDAGRDRGSGLPAGNRASLRRWFVRDGGPIRYDRAVRDGEVDKKGVFTSIDAPGAGRRTGQGTTAV